MCTPVGLLLRFGCDSEIFKKSNLQSSQFENLENNQKVLNEVFQVFQVFSKVFSLFFFVTQHDTASLSPLSSSIAPSL